MSGGDKLPVLAYARKRPDPVETDPEQLTRAIAALREALQGDAARAKARRALAPRERPEEEEFSPPVGAPRITAQRRAGPSGPLVRGTAEGAVGAERPPPDPLARRILSLHLPRFSMERYLAHLARTHDTPPEEVPLALAVEGPHGPVVHATNRAAELQGVAAGARVVDMRALCPGLRVEFADTGGDAAALDRLVLWARRWCPWTVGDGLTARGGAGLVLDTTGSDHLWGGERAMLEEIEGTLSVLGITAQGALAPTRGAAWALARFGPVRAICGAQDMAIQTGPLPVRALRLDGDTVLVLQRLGLKTIGDLAAVPRLSLARRFSRAALGANPLLRLDQLAGRLAEPVQPPDEPPRFSVQARLAEPVQDPTHHLPELARALCADLKAAGMGLRRAVLTVYRTDGEVSHVAAATSAAMADEGHLVRLFEGKLERIDPGLGFDLITLHAGVTEAVQARQPTLEGEARQDEALARLIDRLSGRFGPGALSLPAPRARHIPERAEAWRPAMAGMAPAAPASLPPRPLRLFDPPEEIRVLYAVPEGPPAQFVWRRQVTRVSRYDGPERIAPEWWADRPGTRLRDYYRVEDQWGLRYWIYRHGVEGDDRGFAGEAPRWFLHGAFP